MDENAPEETSCEGTFFCRDDETCNGDGACDETTGTAHDCADEFACTVDECDDDTDECTHVPNHDLCTEAICQPDHPDADVDGCAPLTPADYWLREIADDCRGERSTLRPLPGEESRRAVARLEPETYPVEIDRVRYILGNGDTADGPCDAGLPHRLEIFTGTGDSPPADPSVRFTIPVDEELVSGEYVVIDKRLPSTILLGSGESLFVAIETVISGGEAVCPARCTLGTTPASNYWSDSASPPYGWSWGDWGDLIISAHVVAAGE